jgi:DNA-binding NtrC family response regulator
MADALLVLSRDSALVHEIRETFSGRFNLVVRDDPGSTEDCQTPETMGGVIVHLTPEILDGRSPQEILGWLAAGNRQPAGNGNGHIETEPSTLGQRLDEAERKIIEESLRRHHNRRMDTASELGISRVTLYNKMKKLGMQQRRLPR